MDGYLRRNFEDFVVPNQKGSDTLADTDIWSGWTVSSPEAPGKECIMMDHYDAMNHGFSGGFYGQTEMGPTKESESSNVCGDFSSDLPMPQEGNNLHQLHDFSEIEHMDDIFLNSILEDVPGSWSFQPSENGNVQCTSGASNGRDVPMVPCNSDPSHGISFKDNNWPNEYNEVTTSLEELVLQNLQRATEKMTDETRKCFRDTFYRLAKNSQGASHSPEVLPVQDQDGVTRCRRNRDKDELETNSMDRAIMNLTFNKMESNVGIYCQSERVSPT